MSASLSLSPDRGCGFARRARLVALANMRGEKEATMAVLWAVMVTAFVLLVLLFVAYALSRPFGRHDDQFRDQLNGKRRWESPHLESRDEYERTHDTGSPHLESWADCKRTHDVLA
jgi:hypothetical protein